MGNDNLSKTILNQDADWTVREAYNSLRTNLMFSVNGIDRKVVAITSATPREGKTINAINLALSLVQIGKKVILIDCDMRLPMVANRLCKKQPPHGLSHCLSRQATVSECLTRDPSGLILMTSGTVPPDPTLLLQSKQMEQLIAVFRKEFDYIILDLPPVNTVADSYVISRLTDGYLLVVRDGYTDKRELSKAIKSLRMANATILGLIENDARRPEKSYYNRYSYEPSEKTNRG